MKRTLALLFLLTIFLVSTATAAVEVTYNFNVNNVQIEAHDCIDNQCNGNIGQSSLQFPDGKSTSNGKIRIIFPDSLATPHGYAIYYVSSGYLPQEFKATWNTNGQPGLATTSFPINFNKKQTCSALIDNFAVTNDVMANVPLIIRTQSSLDATTHSAFTLTDNDVEPVPSQFKNDHYSVDTHVFLDIFDSNGNLAQTFPPYIFSKELGNPLFADESRDVEFTWIPTVPGAYSAQMKTVVVDDQCLTAVDQVTSKPQFTVLASPPQDRCDTLVNNLKVLNDLPVRQGDEVQVEFTKISNYADGNGGLSPIATDVTLSVKDENGNQYVSSAQQLAANADSGSSTHLFTFTAAQQGISTITVTGVGSDTQCSGKPNPTDVISIDLAVAEPGLFDVEFAVIDAATGNPVVGAEINLDGQVVITDVAGLATIRDLQAGTYTYTIIHPDYFDLTQSVEITDFDRVVFISLSSTNRGPQFFGLPDVTISKDANQFPVFDLDDFVIDDDTADSLLTFTSTSSANLLANIDPITHVLDLTVVDGQTGTGTVTITVTDPEGLTATDSITVTIIDGPVVGATQCSDGIDNDNDGFIDFGVDPGCSDLLDDDETDNGNGGGNNPQCSDNVDNDNDGLVDFPSDPGCSDANDNDESNNGGGNGGNNPACNDGLDNDNDGLIDFPADPGCIDANDNDESNNGGGNGGGNGGNFTPQCRDGIDNDGDGLIDFPNDLDCDSSNDNDESFDINSDARRDQRRIDLDINQIRIPNDYNLRGGQDLVAFIRYENDGAVDFENVKLSMSIEELGVRTSTGPNDLGSGKRQSETLVLGLPDYVMPGYYYVRFSISNIDTKRTVYREVLIL